MINFEGLCLDRESFEVYFQHKAIPLTPKEFAMLALFLDYQNRAFSREHLIHAVWGYDVTIEDRTIDSHVRNLREKLRKVVFRRMITCKPFGASAINGISLQRKQMEHKARN